MNKLKLLDFNKISTSEQEVDAKQDFVPTKVRWQKKFKKIIAHNGCVYKKVCLDELSILSTIIVVKLFFIGYMEIKDYFKNP